MSENIFPIKNVIPVEPNRRLIKPSNSLLEEFVSTEFDTRIISMPRGSEMARSHEELFEMRLPVFSGLYRNEHLWLNIPEGTRSVRSVLRFIARDVTNYGEIFFKMGSVLSELENAGVGFPEVVEDRSILDSFAFSIDEDETYGGNIYLAPPYLFNPDKKIGQTLGSIALELEGTELFSEAEMTELLSKTHQGWHDGRA